MTALRVVRCSSLVLLTWFVWSNAWGQTAVPSNEHEVKSRLPKSSDNVQDNDDIWVLDFRFKEPRLITVDIPGKGRKLCWYLWYQVINNRKEPHIFIPDFDLVTVDKPHVYNDQVLPKVQDAIRKVEDPTGHLDIRNSVTIASEPIPPSKADAFPRAITGVAIWTDVDPEASHYSIFVTGLSNGWSVDDREIIRRKTLKLNFRRLGDQYYQDSREIRFVAPFEWVYRASDLKTGDTPLAPGIKQTNGESPAKKPEQPEANKPER